MWLFATLSSYFFLAVSGVIDKFLLSETKFHPGAYAFLIAILGLMGFVLVPWAPAPSHGWLVILLAGAVFIWALYLFFMALARLETSRTLPLTGTLVALFSLGISVFVFNEVFTTMQVWAFTLLVVGGILISYEPKRVVRDQGYGWLAAIVAALLFAIGFHLLKVAYAQVGFLPGFVWSRVGGLLAGLLLLFVPGVLSSLQAMFKPSEGGQSGKLPLVLVGQGCGALGAFLQNYAIALGSVVMVNAMQGVQYAFLFLMTVFLSVKFPQILRESQNKILLVQKILAIVIIGLGLWYVA